MTAPRRFNHVVEVGAGDRYTAQSLVGAQNATKISLYEANVLLWADLERAVKEIREKTTTDINAYAVAVNDVGGDPRPFFHLGYASYLVGAPSFLALSVEPGGEDLWRPLVGHVPVRGVNEVVTSDVDGLVLTVNGAEASILSAMTARPGMIRTKVYAHCAAHWAQYSNVQRWMEREGYKGYKVESNEHGTFFSLEYRREG